MVTTLRRKDSFCSLFQKAQVMVAFSSVCLTRHHGNRRRVYWEQFFISLQTENEVRQEGARNDITPTTCPSDLLPTLELCKSLHNLREQWHQLGTRTTWASGYITHSNHNIGKKISFQVIFIMNEILIPKSKNETQLHIVFFQLIMVQWFSMFVNSNINKSCFSNMAPQTQVPKGYNCFHSNTLILFFFILLCEYLLRNRIRQTPTNPKGVGGTDHPGWPVLVNVTQGWQWWSSVVFIMPQSQGTHGK